MNLSIKKNNKHDMSIYICLVFFLLSFKKCNKLDEYIYLPSLFQLYP